MKNRHSLHFVGLAIVDFLILLFAVDPFDPEQYAKAALYFILILFGLIFAFVFWAAPLYDENENPVPLETPDVAPAERPDPATAALDAE